MRAIAALALLLPFVLVAAVQAAPPEVEIAAPERAQVGEEVQIRVALHAADGSPVADAQVALYREASFAGVSGEMELARAVTDAEGVATLVYEPRTAGDLELTVRYAAPDGEAGSTTIAISVAEAPQVHRSTAGIQVPGLNVGLLIAVLAAVWAILFAVALLVVAIARAGAVEGAAPEGVAQEASTTMPAASASGMAGAGDKRE